MRMTMPGFTPGQVQGSPPTESRCAPAFAGATNQSESKHVAITSVRKKHIGLKASRSTAQHACALLVKSGAHLTIEFTALLAQSAKQALRSRSVSKSSISHLRLHLSMTHLSRAANKCCAANMLQKNSMS